MKIAAKEGRTYRRYVDHCVLCGRELVGNSSKIYITADILRKLMPWEKDLGGYVCRSLKKCAKLELRQRLNELCGGQ
jgi:hypothetical protein